MERSISLLKFGNHLDLVTGLVSDNWGDLVVEELCKFCSNDVSKFKLVDNFAAVCDNWHVAISIWAGAGSSANLIIELVDNFWDRDTCVDSH